MIHPVDLSPVVQSGPVHLPGQLEYSIATTPWNVAVAQQPALVGVPRSEEELVAMVREAVAHGLRIAPQSTGHAASALAPDALDGALLLRLHEYTGVTVDPVRRTARIVGGTLWRDVLATCAPHGLTALHGSAGDVSAIGFLLGGGLSFYSRAHGLGTSAVRAFDVLTSDGEVRRASSEENPDLFWALKGGGGSFGTVIAVEIDLLPLTDVVAGMMLWDIGAAAQIVPAWIAWSANAPETATTSLRLMNFPPLPELPDFLRGRRLVVIDGAVLADDDAAAEILAPLRDLAPEMDTVGRIPAAALLAVHMDPPGPTPTVTDHALLGPLTAEAAGAFVDAGTAADSSLMFAELRHLGGALARPIDAALDRVDGDYALFTASIAATPELAARGLADTSAVVSAMGPWSTGRALSNFDERPHSGAGAFPADTYARLLRIRKAYDPLGAWVAARPVE